MKYRDLITLFVVLGFFGSLGYTFGVDINMWFIPVIFGVLLGLTYYKLWL